MSIVLSFLVATALVAMAGMEPMADHGRYLGAPDLPLTAAMVSAGGGPSHFDAARLSSMLAAQHSAAELARLDARFGEQRTRRYLATFTAFVNLALTDAERAGTRLPPPNPALAHDPYELAAAMRAAGIVPDGRFDVGYMIEHLISRPIHVEVMQTANAAPAIGPAVNADFHVILTAEMDDLRSLYHLPR